MNVQVTFIERSPRAHARTSGVRRDHREREHVQARERELHERSPDARERRMNVSCTLVNARSPDVRERSLSLIFFTYLLTYFQTS